MLVSLTLERLVAVIASYKVRLWFTKTSVITGIVCTAVTLAAVDLHFFWTEGLVPKSSDNGTVEYHCHTEKRYRHFVLEVWPWIDLTVASICPFVIIFTCNMAIILYIFFHSRATRRELHSGQRVKFSSMTAMLVTVSITFIILTMPVCIFLSVCEGCMDEADEKTNLIFTALNLWSYLNYCINCFLYCLSGPKFRKEVKDMFFSIRRHC